MMKYMKNKKWNVDISVKENFNFDTIVDDYVKDQLEEILQWNLNWLKT